MTVISRTFQLGGDRPVNRLGYGAMRLTGQPGNVSPYPDWDAGLALLRRAADLGVGFFDSAWAYGPEAADRIVGEALEGRDVVLATKGGVDKPEPGRIVVDGSRDTLLLNRSLNIVVIPGTTSVAHLEENLRAWDLV